MLLHGQASASGRMKFYNVSAVSFKMKEDKGSRKRRVATEVNFGCRCEPSEFIIVILFNKKSGFRQVVFRGDLLHEFRGKPFG